MLDAQKCPAEQVSPRWRILETWSLTKPYEREKRRPATIATVPEPSTTLHFGSRVVINLHRPVDIESDSQQVLIMLYVLRWRPFDLLLNAHINHKLRFFAHFALRVTLEKQEEMSMRTLQEIPRMAAQWRLGRYRRSTPKQRRR